MGHARTPRRRQDQCAEMDNACDSLHPADCADGRVHVPVLPDRPERPDDPTGDHRLRMELVAGGGAVGQLHEPVREQRDRHGEGVAKLRDHRRRQPGFPDAVRLDGGVRLARIPFRGKGIFFAAILLTLMVPSAVTFVPIYVVVAKLDGVNTLWGIVVPGLFSAFATFLFRQFYLDFPSEIEEAARLDGNSYFGVYWRMLLPNSLGIMAAL